MTRAFDLLKRSPQTKLDLGTLHVEERPLVRVIKISTRKGHRKKRSTGRFTPVYYLAGDQRRAAEVFVEANRDRLENVDFSSRNVVESSVDRAEYDWIRHAVGWCTLEVYDSVVVEERADGSTWVVEGQRYVDHVDRRYTTSEVGSALVTGESLRELYDRLDGDITESFLRAAGVEGDVRQVLEYYRVAPQFACGPVFETGETEKQPSTEEQESARNR